MKEKFSFAKRLATAKLQINILNSLLIPFTFLKSLPEKDFFQYSDFCQGFPVSPPAHDSLTPAKINDEMFDINLYYVSRQISRINIIWLEDSRTALQGESLKYHLTLRQFLSVRLGPVKNDEHFIEMQGGIMYLHLGLAGVE